VDGKARLNGQSMTGMAGGAAVAMSRRVMMNVFGDCRGGLDARKGDNQAQRQ
jgi:hypothetical protein